MKQSNEEAAGPDHVAFGDLRGVVDCEYVVDALRGSSDGSVVVCAGSHRLVIYVCSNEASSTLRSHTLITYTVLVATTWILSP